jgi:hypothetical protein
MTVLLLCIIPGRREKKETPGKFVGPHDLSTTDDLLKVLRP